MYRSRALLKGRGGFQLFDRASVAGRHAHDKPLRFDFHFWNLIAAMTPAIVAAIYLSRVQNSMESQALTRKAIAVQEIADKEVLSGVKTKHHS